VRVLCGMFFALLFVEERTMKILFTSDLHGDCDVIKDFVRILDNGDFAAGIIGGDLLSNDLVGRDNTEEMKILEIISSLHETTKPILMIRGNRDLARIVSETNIQDIHMRKVRLGRYNVIGYGYIKPRPPRALQQRDLKRLAASVDSNSILVTHKPPCELVREKRPLYSDYIELILKKKKPKLYLYGHFHGSIGQRSIGIIGSYAGTGQFVAIDLDSNTVKTVPKANTPGTVR
jgi:Icc-related predicted phosphoesterase